AGAGERLRVLREGHLLFAGDRPVEELLRRRVPRRSAARAREADRQTADARSGPAVDPPGLPGAAGSAGRRRAVAGARPTPAAATRPGCLQAPYPAREPGAAAVAGVRGPALDR